MVEAAASSGGASGKGTASGTTSTSPGEGAAGASGSSLADSGTATGTTVAGGKAVGAAASAGESATASRASAGAMRGDSGRGRVLAAMAHARPAAARFCGGGHVSTTHGTGSHPREHFAPEPNDIPNTDDTSATTRNADSLPACCSARCTPHAHA
eukprot:TRINITY_DN75989_c0_g1_i1.p4 TRINITY_DN75989_c0_g1~~TRINITY_DN75989_c0_g1_i1.p4  ORF type:complete len:155 (+),score=23.24 TRINITY_DN75989_c0_g1_i1:118-582(+)